MRFLISVLILILINLVHAQCNPPAGAVAANPNMVYYAGGSCTFYDAQCNVLLVVPQNEASWSCSPALAAWVLVNPVAGGYYEFPHYGNIPPQVNFNRYMDPFWDCDTVYNELVFLNGVNSTANLMFEPSQILSVKNYNYTTTFTQGVDFQMNGNTITQLSPNVSTSVTTTFGSGLENKQHSSWTNVTYIPNRSNWNNANNFGYRGQQLPKTMSKLLNQQPLTIQAIGMSITCGLNVSGFIGDPNNFQPNAPYMHSYIDMLGTKLNNVYGNNVTMHNSSCGGKTISWVDTYCEALVNPNNPDLVIIDMGMNDIWGTSTASFITKMQSAMNKMKAHNPDLEFILISNMLPDVNGMGAPANGAIDMHGFQAALWNLDAMGTVVFDMTAMSDSIYQRKGANHCTANSLHPNDYLARWYAQGLFEVFNQPQGASSLELNPTDVHIFPNPSDGSFTIEMGNLIHSAKVELFDLKGAKLFESEQNESISEYDLSFLALTGMYIVKITHGNQTLEEHIQIH
jgi:lysophospholipase L1-like esterase